MKKMNKKIRNILYGFLAWLIPFVTAFFFYSKEGGLVIDIFLFKSIMIIVVCNFRSLPFSFLFQKDPCQLFNGKYHCWINMVRNKHLIRFIGFGSYVGNVGCGLFHADRTTLSCHAGYEHNGGRSFSK